MSNFLFDYKYDIDYNNLEGLNRVIVFFFFCGDLSGFDFDRIYFLNFEDGKDYVYYFLI